MILFFSQRESGNKEEEEKKLAFGETDDYIFGRSRVILVGEKITQLIFFYQLIIFVYKILLL